MDPNLQKALDGSLQFQAFGAPFAYTITNSMVVPIFVYTLNSNNRFMAITSPAYLLPTIGWNYDLPANTWVAIKTATGAFVCVFQLDTTNLNIIIDCDRMSSPNDIGTRPTSKTVAVPPDSARVMVGCGGVAGAYVVTREQYWRRGIDSYVVPAGVKRSVGSTSVAGMDRTTTDVQTVSQSLGLSGGGSWGAISAQMSYSLSTSSSSTQTVTLREETTRYETLEFDNSSGSTAQMYLQWQLMDIYTVYDPNGIIPKGSIVSAELPAVMDGPTTPPSL
jgi:hypothetical protein